MATKRKQNLKAQIMAKQKKISEIDKTIYNIKEQFVDKRLSGKGTENDFLLQRQQTSPLFQKKSKLKDEQFDILKKKIKSKKNFVFKTTERRASYGTDVTADIFKVAKTGLVPVGQTKWNTGSMKGDTSEVLTALIKEKQLPEELGIVTSGYYNWSDAEKLGIKIQGI